MASLTDVTDATFAERVLESETPVVVDFWAPWCRPCKAIEPSLAGIAAESGGALALVRLDIDENLATPSRYGVLSIPTVILFSGGEPRVRIAGPRSRRVYEAAFAPHVHG